MSPILGIWASQNYPRITGSYESIQTITVSSEVSSVSFTSIPSTYTHLQIRIIAKTNDTDTTGNDNIYVTYNGDTGSNYSWHVLYANYSTLASAGAGNTSAMLTGKLGNANVANTYGTTVLDILDYKNTSKYKTQRSLSGLAINALGSNLFLGSGSWRNTNAITSITLVSGSAMNWVSGSKFALYGIKGA